MHVKVNLVFFCYCILVCFSYLLFFADCLKGWPLGKTKSKKNYLLKIFNFFFWGKICSAFQWNGFLSPKSCLVLLVHLYIFVVFSYLLFFADCLKGWPLGKKKSKKNYLFKIFKLFFLGKFGIKCKCILFAVVCIFVSFIFP
jgi:hypothetical protein